MALNTTTLTSAVVISDRQIVVSSATGFAAGNQIRIDEEWMQVAANYTSGTTIPVLRGRDGTATVAHPKTANVMVGLVSDFTLTFPTAMPDGVFLPGSSPFNVFSYSATGAIALPTQPGITVSILNGTSTLTMTLAAPPSDLDGTIMIIAGNGKSASTVAISGNNGIGNAGAGYRTITFQTGGKVSITLLAVNGDWLAINTPITGTSTAISVAIS
jgi:hypothetical protein